MLKSWNLPRPDPESSKREGLWQRTIKGCPGAEGGVKSPPIPAPASLPPSAICFSQLALLF